MCLKNQKTRGLRPGFGMESIPDSVRLHLWHSLKPDHERFQT